MSIVCIQNEDDNPDGPQGYVEAPRGVQEIKEQWAAYVAQEGDDAHLTEFIAEWLVPHGYTQVQIENAWLPWSGPSLWP